MWIGIGIGLTLVAIGAIKIRNDIKLKKANPNAYKKKKERQREKMTKKAKKAVQELEKIPKAIIKEGNNAFNTMEDTIMPMLYGPSQNQENKNNRSR